MSFEKPFVFNPKKQETETLEIPSRFNLSEDPEVQEGLRDALKECNRLLDEEKYNTGRLPNLGLRYQKSILELLLREGSINTKTLKKTLEVEEMAVKDSALRKALELVYILDGKPGEAPKSEGSLDEDDEDEW